MKERTLFANSAWSMIAHALRAIVSLAFVPLVISKIGLVGYGWYSIIMLLSYYQGLVAQADLGYPTFLINQVSRSEVSAQAISKRVGSLLTFLFAANCILLLLSFLAPMPLELLLGVSGSFVDEFRLSLRLILVTNFFSMYIGVCSVLWIGRHRTVYLKKFETSSYFLFVLSSAVLLFVKPALHMLAIAFLVSQAFLALTLVFTTKKQFAEFISLRKISRIDLRADWSGWKPFFFSRLNGLAQRQTDLTFISLLLGPQFVAAYDISLKIPSLIKGFLGRISEVLGPFSSRSRSREELGFLKVLSEKLVTVEVAIGIALVVNLYFFGADICALWLGEDQRSIGEFFFVASFLNVVVPPASVLLAILLGQGARANALTWWPSAISVFNVLLTIPITLYFGIIGTISLTVVQYAMLSAVAWTYARKDIGFRLNFLNPLWIATASVTTLLALTILWASDNYFRNQPPIYMTMVGQLVLLLALALMLWSEAWKLRRMMARKAAAVGAQPMPSEQGLDII